MLSLCGALYSWLHASQVVAWAQVVTHCLDARLLAPCTRLDAHAHRGAACPPVEPAQCLQVGRSPVSQCRCKQAWCCCWDVWAGPGRQSCGAASACACSTQPPPRHCCYALPWPRCGLRSPPPPPPCGHRPQRATPTTARTWATHADRPVARRVCHHAGEGMPPLQSQQLGQRGDVTVWCGAASQGAACGGLLDAKGGRGRSHACPVSQSSAVMLQPLPP